MVNRDQEEARDRFLSRLQQAVSCVSRAVVVRGRPGPGEPEYWTFEQRYVPLQGRYRLEFSLLHTYTLRQEAGGPGSWRARSAAYFYQLRERGGPEVILFHWHPLRNLVDFPHLHAAGQAGSVIIEPRHHVPTGRVSLETVIRFAITALHVRPLRPDWRQILDDGERDFAERRTW